MFSSVFPFADPAAKSGYAGNHRPTIEHYLRARPGQDYQETVPTVEDNESLCIVFGILNGKTDSMGRRSTGPCKG